MKVAVVQMESSTDREKNIEASYRLLEKAKNSDLVVFPEYQIYAPAFDGKDDMKTISEPLDGKFVKSITEIARSESQKIILNIPERNQYNLKPFNTAIYIDELGLILKYRKLHLFDAFGFRESSVFEKGDARPAIFNGSGDPLGVLICYDLRFPEPARMLALDGAKLIIYQAGWFAGERKYDQWKTLLKARAMENGVFVIGAAQTGHRFTGHSMVISPYGDVLAEMGTDEGVITFDIDFSLVEKYREEVPVLKHRRTDVYDVLDVDAFKLI
ncbi:nitrilase related protein [Thermoplasma acidophilum]|uniref:Nitrilase related protein n=1 Tax=Thermoplasma acidophilum (strain ATCC 25905 / DSM 1728 / JCM 9062 / NBRC 15155 / AMRC-C165) TaxID=273075 RepID=Q9HIW8_THEAC|nr:carbon-nitrogen hydrolase family protein [Thermoplasma acidophilum]MCY0852165.1 carbon-nitrogen hydrolase family protein [Thermoplasma acidophilum]CAC12333.1 nitrilase related protein [Thermoplasma acidophilum]